MTFRQLLKELCEFTSDELDQTATVQTWGDEFAGIVKVMTSKPNDPADGILDHGHRYLLPLGIYYQVDLEDQKKIR
ncbi:MAG: hypothetical protein ACXAC5_02125 [Promethearchaeota archaeon]